MISSVLTPNVTENMHKKIVKECDKLNKFIWIPGLVIMIKETTI